MKLATKVLYTSLVILLFISNVLWLFNLNRVEIIDNSIDCIIIIITIYTIILTKIRCKVKKRYQSYIFFILFITGIVTVVAFFYKETNLQFASNLLSVTLLPISIITFDEFNISNRLLGIIISLIGFSSFFNNANMNFINSISYILVPIIVLVILNEKKTLIKLFYIIITIRFPFIVAKKFYLSFFIVLAELIAFSHPQNERTNNHYYIIIYVLYIYLVIQEKIIMEIPYNLLIIALIIKSIPKDFEKILIIVKDKNEKSFKNFINNINQKEYLITIIEKKDCNKIKTMIKKLYYLTIKYNDYCCICLYDLDIPFMSRISNNCVIYLNNLDNKITNIGVYRKVICKSLELKESIIKKYKLEETKIVVINNYIDIDQVESGRIEKINLNKVYGRVLIVFDGEINKKNIDLLIKLIKKNRKIEIWALGKVSVNVDKIFKQNKIRKKIRIFDKCNNKYSYLVKADYVMVDSNYEYFPNIYLEILLLNKDIISFKNYNDEYISLKDYCFILSKDDYIDEINGIVIKGDTKIKKIYELDIFNIQKNRKRKWDFIFKKNI